MFLFILLFRLMSIRNFLLIKQFEMIYNYRIYFQGILYLSILFIWAHLLPDYIILVVVAFF